VQLRPIPVGLRPLLVATGTTATIVATYTNSGGVGAFQIYTIKGLSSFTPVASNSNWTGSTDPISTTVATTSGGVVVAGGVEQSSVATGNTITGTETYTTDSSFDAGFSVYGAAVGHASGVATNASSTVTATLTTGGGNHTAISAVSWR
jgi:hypothetical protein